MNTTLQDGPWDMYVEDLLSLITLDSNAYLSNSTSTWSHPRHNDPKVDEYYARYAREMDPAKRKAIAKELAEFMADKMYWNNDLGLALLHGGPAVDEGVRRTTPSSRCTTTRSGSTSNAMRVYILRRLLGIVPTVLMITLVVFVMMRSIPGDPVVALLGDAYTEEDAIKVREAYGLDKPVLVQYVIWLGKLVQGDWGTSILSGRPVLQDVLVRLPVTLELIVLSMVVALAIAIPAAIIGAVSQNTWPDYAATSVAMIGVSIPEFFVGVLLLLVFSFGLGGLAAQLGLGVPARHLPERWCAA